MKLLFKLQKVIHLPHIAKYVKFLSLFILIFYSLCLGEGKSTKDYFKELSEELKQKLYLIFQPDFEIFDYDTNDVL